MKKKVCLITGATSGVGLEPSIALAKKNFDLILISRSEDKLNKLSENDRCPLCRENIMRITIMVKKKNNIL